MDIDDEQGELGYPAAPCDADAFAAESSSCVEQGNFALPSLSLRQLRPTRRRRAYVGDRLAAEGQNFRPYRPLLTQYRQLASNSPPPDAESALTLDWGRMSSIILTHRLQRDPDVELCPFEAAGGRCTDLKCPHVHLDRAEPTGASNSTFRIRSSTDRGR